MNRRTDTGIDPNAPARRASVWWVSFGCGGMLVAAITTCSVLVATSDHGGNESAAVRRRIALGMTWKQFLDVIEGTPETSFACTTRAQPSVPPCPEVRVTSHGDWFTSHSFRVRFDPDGIVSAVTEPEYDYDW